MIKSQTKIKWAKWPSNLKTRTKHHLKKASDGDMSWAVADGLEFFVSCDVLFLLLKKAWL
jgi:hypothetical protein